MTGTEGRGGEARRGEARRGEARRGEGAIAPPMQNCVANRKTTSQRPALARRRLTWAEVQPAEKGRVQRRRRQRGADLRLRLLAPAELRAMCHTFSCAQACAPARVRA